MSANNMQQTAAEHNQQILASLGEETESGSEHPDKQKSRMFLTESAIFQKGLYLLPEAKGKYREAAGEHEIRLQDVSGIEVVREGRKVFFFLAGVFFTNGLAISLMEKEAAHPIGYALLVIAAVFGVLFFARKQSVLHIEHNGGELLVDVSRYSAASVKEFLEKAASLTTEKEYE